jgi:hypothetical protein
VKRALKALAWFIAVGAVLRLVGAVVARSFEGGRAGEERDEVRLAAVWGGRDFESKAAALRSLQARVIVGGLNLDLTGATLHPEGAAVELHVHVGGVNIEVPDGWRVELDDRTRAGGIAVDVPAEVADGAPLLEIRIRGAAAGVNVEAQR